MNSNSSLQCPGCGSAQTDRSGPITDTLLTLDAKSASSFTSADLYICYSCGLGFRFPLCDQEALHQIYSQTSDGLWSSHNAVVRKDWDLAESFIKSSPRQSSILDVGCYTGSFLQRFKGHACYGVEPSSKAADRARASGVSIISDNYTTLENRPNGFDFITSFDVIEHIPSPKYFLQVLADQLRPGGFLLISTGNFHHWTFRLMKHRYYYCSHPEHIVFLSPSIVNGYAKELRIEPIATHYFSHNRTSLLRNTYQCLFNFVYLCSPLLIAQLRSLAALLKKTSSRRGLGSHPPFWGAAKDHFLAVYLKS